MGGYVTPDMGDLWILSDYFNAILSNMDQEYYVLMLNMYIWMLNSEKIFEAIAISLSLSWSTLHIIS